MDLTTGDMLIFSGEGENGTWERYFGARTPKAIKARLSRERCGGDRWAQVWIELPGWADKIIHSKVYGRLDAGLESIIDQRVVKENDIIENPAAKLAATKRGRSPASAINGKLGGRPRK